MKILLTEFGLESVLQQLKGILFSHTKKVAEQLKILLTVFNGLEYVLHYVEILGNPFFSYKKSFRTTVKVLLTVFGLESVLQCRNFREPFFLIQKKLQNNG